MGVAVEMVELKGGRNRGAMHGRGNGSDGSSRSGGKIEKMVEVKVGICCCFCS